MALFKTADESLQLGHSLVQRGDFANARARFDEAVKKYLRQGDGYGAALANAHASIAAMSVSMENPAALRYAAETLRKLGGTTLRVGVRDLPAVEVANEAELLAEEIELRAVNAITPQQARAQSDLLRSLATQFQAQFGNRILILPELFRRQQTLGTAKSYPLIARSEELLGEAVVADDPKAAAEHYQTAYHYWLQAGNQAQAGAAMTKFRDYGMSAACWFCGREAAGAGVHFTPMPSALTDFLRKKAGDDALPTFDRGSGTIFACRGCHGAIHSLANQLAEQHAREVEIRLQAEIDNLRARLSHVEMSQ